MDIKTFRGPACMFEAEAEANAWQMFVESLNQSTPPPSSEEEKEEEIGVEVDVKVDVDLEHKSKKTIIN